MFNKHELVLIPSPFIKITCSVCIHEHTRTPEFPNSLAPLKRKTGFQSICYQTYKSLQKSEVGQFSDK